MNSVNSRVSHMTTNALYLSGLIDMADNLISSISRFGLDEQQLRRIDQAITLIGTANILVKGVNADLSDLHQSLDDMSIPGD